MSSRIMFSLCTAECCFIVKYSLGKWAPLYLSIYSLVCLTALCVFSIQHALPVLKEKQ